MSRFHMMALAMALPFVLAVAPAAAQKKDHGNIRWIASMAKAKKQAAKLKKPMMVDYYADWCPPCRAMFATTYKNKDVVERSKRFVPVLVDIDKQRKDADAARIEAVPTVVFYDSRGKEILRSEGYHQPKDMLKLMSEAEQKAKK